MFEWLRSYFRRSEKQERRRLVQAIDALHCVAHGGPFTTVSRVLGTLPLGSGALVLCDPQRLSSLTVHCPRTAEVEISAQLRQYPSGREMVAALTLRLGAAASVNAVRSIGRVEIDSARLVVADKEDLQAHWTEIGPDRIGVISTAPDDRVLRMLTERFHLRTVRRNEVRAEVVGSVSEPLGREIERFVASLPEYAAHPEMAFRVQTNNSFDRVNRLDKPWAFVPIGNANAPRMFACETGHGDGVYGVQGEFAGDAPHGLKITFLADDAP